MPIKGMKNLSKTTVVSTSAGSLLIGLVTVWTMSGIGRPLFAADLAAIETSIKSLDDRTAIAFLEQQKSGLQTEIRALRRELRGDPSDTDLIDDIEDVEDDIDAIDVKIMCIRTVGCTV